MILSVHPYIRTIPPIFTNDQILFNFFSQSSCIHLTPPNVNNLPIFAFYRQSAQSIPTMQKSGINNATYKASNQERCHITCYCAHGISVYKHNKGLS